MSTGADEQRRQPDRAVVTKRENADNRRFVLEAGRKPERVDKVLTELMGTALPGAVSRATVQRWIAEGRVLVGGKPCRARDEVGAGAVLDVSPGPPPASEAEPDPGIVLDVLFEDAHVIVINKPAGMVVHPGRGHRHGTLVSGLLARPGFDRAPVDPLDPEGKMRPGIVHRLDKGTSGVLVCAKDDRTREGLKAQLASHTVERVYRAVVVGVPEPGTIETLHSRHPGTKRRFTSRTSIGRKAITRIDIDEIFAQRAALVTCRLQTGRTHQIRVHLFEQAGTPILADPLYGAPPNAPELRIIADRLRRQALHAQVLGFTHPVTEERLRFTTPIPDDMQDAISRLRALDSKP